MPDWLKNAITLERLEMNMRALKGEDMIGTDAEACAYLYTAPRDLLRLWTMTGARFIFILPVKLIPAIRATGYLGISGRIIE